MPFPMKVQPIDAADAILCGEQAKPLAAATKSRLKRLFERQFPGVLRPAQAEKLAGAGDGREKDRDAGDLDPSSVCLDKMVQSFMEEINNEKPARCGRNRCNCFHGNCDDSSDDDLDFLAGEAPAGAAASSSDAVELIKGLVLCASVAERNLLADVSKLMEKNKICKRKAELRKLVADGLRAAGYDASLCKSRWEKSPSFPAGEYEYVDVVVGAGGQERLLVDVDFRSEFEIARSTKGYRAVLQSLPTVFVGKGDRLQQIVVVASEAARQSLRKKGLHFPPWRKPEYMRAKWLAPYERCAPPKTMEADEGKGGQEAVALVSVSSMGVPVPPMAQFVEHLTGNPGGVESTAVPWNPPPVKPMAAQRGTAVVAGLTPCLGRSPELRISGFF